MAGIVLVDEGDVEGRRMKTNRANHEILTRSPIRGITRTRTATRSYAAIKTPVAITYGVVDGDGSDVHASLFGLLQRDYVFNLKLCTYRTQPSAN